MSSPVYGFVRNELVKRQAQADKLSRRFRTKAPEFGQSANAAGTSDPVLKRQMRIRSLQQDAADRRRDDSGEDETRPIAVVECHNFAT